MRHYETRTIPPVPAREKQVVVGMSCDLCGRKAKRPDNGWADGNFDINDTEVSVTVKREEGSNYPETGHKTTYSVDLCPVCFKDRLIPWLVSQGATVREEECDW